MNEDKSRIRSFGFLGFEFRRVRKYPQMKTRSGCESSRRYSDAIDRNRWDGCINPILRGWVNYFAIGHS